MYQVYNYICKIKNDIIMIYQLPSGKTIELSLEQYLEMTDEDIEYIVAFDYGEEINNPFYGSTIEDTRKFIPRDELDIDKTMLEGE